MSLNPMIHMLDTLQAELTAQAEDLTLRAHDLSRESMDDIQRETARMTGAAAMALRHVVVAVIKTKGAYVEAELEDLKAMIDAARDHHPSAGPVKPDWIYGGDATDNVHPIRPEGK